MFIILQKIEMFFLKYYLHHILKLNIEHLKMNTMIEIVEADKGTIYVLNGVAYDIHFPLEWAIHPKRFDDNYASCPSDCNNCLEYGSYNGVFIGYCLNCARAYGYERGNGFETYGVERSGDGREEKNSVWNTYLKNVKLDEIGWNSLVEPFVDEWLSEDEEEEEDDDYKRFCKNDFGYDYHLNSPSESSEEDDRKIDIMNNHNYNYYDNYYNIQYFDDEESSPLTVQDLDLESQKEDDDFDPIHENNNHDYYDIDYLNFNEQISPLTVQELGSKKQEEEQKEDDVFEPNHPYRINHDNYDIEYFDDEGGPLTIQDLNLETQEEYDLSVEYIEL